MKKDFRILTSEQSWETSDCHSINSVALQRSRSLGLLSTSQSASQEGVVVVVVMRGPSGGGMESLHAQGGLQISSAGTCTRRFSGRMRAVRSPPLRGTGSQRH